MEDKKITAEEIKAMLAGDIDALAEEMAAAMNSAKAGRIIAQSGNSGRTIASGTSPGWGGRAVRSPVRLSSRRRRSAELTAEA